MKELLLTYLGYGDKLFAFSDQSNKKYAFSRVNSSLIHEYDLKGSTHIGTLFKVRYFTVEQGDKDLFILSDLELPKKVADS